MEERSSEGVVLRVWAAVVAIGAIGLTVIAADNFRARISESPDETRVPEPIEPEGSLPHPPTTFRWTPGHENAIAQVVIHYWKGAVHWSSAPAPPGAHEIQVPPSAWREVQAGTDLMWRVRETVDGKPWAGSRHVPFVFDRDADGYGPGEGPFAPLE